MTVRPVKTPISLGIRPVWLESSLSAGRKVGSLATRWTHCEGSDQTGRIPRLIWVFAGRTTTLLGLSWGGSFKNNIYRHSARKYKSIREETGAQQTVSPTKTCYGSGSPTCFYFRCYIWWTEFLSKLWSQEAHVLPQCKDKSPLGLLPSYEIWHKMTFAPPPPTPPPLPPKELRRWNLPLLYFLLNFP